MKFDSKGERKLEGYLNFIKEFADRNAKKKLNT